MSAFINYLRTGRGVDVADYDTLYLFSIEKPDEFWAAVWSFCGVIGERRGQTVQAADKMPGAVRTCHVSCRRSALRASSRAIA